METAMDKMHKIDRELTAQLVRDCIKQRRLKSTLTIEEVAKHADIDAEELRRIEAGDIVAGADVLYSLSELYKCDVNDFFMGVFDHKMPSRSAGSENAESLLEKHVLRDFKNMASSEMRFAFANMISGASEFTRFLDMQGYAMRKVTLP